MPHTDKGRVALTVTHLGCVSGSPAAPQGLAPVPEMPQKGGWHSLLRNEALILEGQLSTAAGPVPQGRGQLMACSCGLASAVGMPFPLPWCGHFLPCSACVRNPDTLQDHGRTNDPIPKPFHIAFLALSTSIFFQTGFKKKRNMNSGTLREKKLAQPFSYTGNSPRTENTKTYYREGKLFH